MSQVLRIRNTALANGLRELLAKTQERLALKQPLHIYLAGGLAVHLYCGTRVTSDVDAEFSARVFLPPDLLVNVRRTSLADSGILEFEFPSEARSATRALAAGCGGVGDPPSREGKDAARTRAASLA